MPRACLLAIVGVTVFASAASHAQQAGRGGGGRGQPPAVPLGPTTSAAVRGGTIHNVTLYGATGDGKHIDSDAINAAIDDAAGAGGGTVYFPAGVYLSYSIRLKSNITLQLDQGARILGAPAGIGGRGYDAAEPNPEGGNYQDGGHSHWKDGLIWGIGLENIAIIGPGIIDGTNISTGDNGGGGRGGRGGGGGGGGFGPGGTARGGVRGGALGARGPSTGPSTAPIAGGGGRGGRGRGGAASTQPQVPMANKTLALKLCKNVTVRDVSFYRGGHFAILATGVDNMDVNNVKFDTNRDAFDIDACRNMRLSDCSVNAPNDDGIVLKASYALGFARDCENITITNCLVCGFEIGSLLDGTYKPLDREVPDRMGPTGRIKFGTESTGGFKNITISNCVFDHCRGLALETVDGGQLEDVTISNITMRHTSNSPIFLRLGSRLHAPPGTPVGTLRRINISDVVVSDADPRYASIIAGIPGNSIEDVKLRNISIQYRGGGTADLADIIPPEDETGYPEPARLGEMPAYGFFIRHVKNLEMSNIDVSFAAPDQRPPFILDDVINAEFRFVTAPRAAETIPTFWLFNVKNFDAYRVAGVADVKKDEVKEGKF
jgi:polygalacturonase